MKRIMFVCNGNICRSVYAEVLLKDMVKKNKQVSGYEICSSGVFAYNHQNPIEETVKYFKQEVGTDVSEHMATNTKESNILDMDLVLCMTNAQKLQLKSTYKEISEKIYTLKEYVVYDNGENSDIDIKDPGEDNLAEESFLRCIKEIENCLHKLIKILD